MNEAATSIRVAVVQAVPQGTRTTELNLLAGATVADALRGAAGMIGDGPGEQWADRVGVFGQRCNLARVLRDGDRVEIYRALAMDAKSARRLRARPAARPPGP